MDDHGKMRFKAFNSNCPTTVNMTIYLGIFFWSIFEIGYQYGMGLVSENGGVAHFCGGVDRENYD